MLPGEKFGFSILGTVSSSPLILHHLDLRILKHGSAVNARGNAKTMHCPDRQAPGSLRGAEGMQSSGFCRLVW